MKKFLSASLAALLIIAGIAPAIAQGITLPANTVYGRTGIGSGPGQAIPFATLITQMGAVPTTRTISTTAPLAGGGDLSADRTLSITGAAGQVLAGSGPAFTRTPTLGVAGSAIGTLALAGNTSGTATITPQAAAGTPTLTLPNASGTFAVGATSPLALSATTGGLTCPTCATTTNGGAISGTAPVAVSVAGAISITGAAGQVLAGSGPAFTATPTLGVAGTTVGTLAFANATSGSITITPPTGALGTRTLTLPIATDTLVGKATTDVLTNKTFDSAGTGNVMQVSGVTVSRGQFPATNTNDNATSGNIGDYVSSDVPSGSAVSLTTGTAANITSISLGAGDWDVSSNCKWSGGATTTVTALNCSMSTTSATLDQTEARHCAEGYSGFALFNNANPNIACGPARFSLSGTTTVFLVLRATFGTSTASGFGFIRARRVR